MGAVNNVESVSKTVEVTIGKSFPGEISGEEARAIGINFNLSYECRRDIQAIEDAIRTSMAQSHIIALR